MSETMTSRQRVLSALSHREPDRVPIDVGSSNNTGISMSAYRRLLQYLGFLGDTEPRPFDHFLQLAEMDERVLRHLGIDTRGLRLGSPDSWKLRLSPDDSYEDVWGVRRRRPAGGLYYDVVMSPFADKEPSLDELDAYAWPDPADPGITRGLADRARTLHEETDYAVVLSVRSGLMHQSTYLRGFSEFYMDLLLNPGFIGGMLERITEIFLEIDRRVLQEAGPYLDVIFVGDDLGANAGPLLSPALYRKFIKPRQRRIFDLIHRLTDARLVYHTCGSVVDFLDDLIEIGVDAINPVQVNVAGMDTNRLKQDFGDRLSFWGAIDTQRVLPHGSPEQVRSEVRRRVRDLGSRGGYVLSAVHNIQADVPPENICAMCEAAMQ